MKSRGHKLFLKRRKIKNLDILTPKVRKGEKVNVINNFDLRNLN